MLRASPTVQLSRLVVLDAGRVEILISVLHYTYYYHNL